ncbi:pancreatic lipase-related protein 2-like [Physella acuta]|uniref:pancreatic lipase-related protein 2-like n=1 Tax=Physella acuta TaxID=109671 RepID=UPI0027DC4E21|nr:pancreatic lipase-related protein 2-like [Physella acuta]
MLLLLLALGTSLAALSHQAEVCYDHVGCFNNLAPYVSVLPKSPTDIAARFLLYTRNNRQNPDSLIYTNAASVTGSHFSASRGTKFIVHGFSSSGTTQWIMSLKDKLLNKGDFNVIAVDWGKGAAAPFYDLASSNIRVVATEIKLLLNIMHSKGLDLGKVHLIGHSLGAHLSGYVGNLFGHNVIGRISGLDPAEPNFLNKAVAARLDADDAKFVDVIHTDGRHFDFVGGYGLMIPCGDVDFYLNGGEHQPGCSGSNQSISCSHGRAHEYFSESVDSTCEFKAHPCDSFAKFENGECFSCGSGCGVAGYSADQHPARGSLYVDTHHVAPFCGFHYHVKIFPYASAADTSGLIYVSLIGTSGKTDFIPTNAKYLKLTKTTTITTNVVYKNDIGTITGVDVRYDRDNGSLGIMLHSATTPTLAIAGIEVLSSVHNTWSSSCRGSFQLHDRAPLHISTAAGRTNHPCTAVG